MAPSARSRAAQRQARPSTSAFRVTKSSKLNTQSQACESKLDAIKEVIHEKVERPVSQLPSQPPKQTSGGNDKKRRRDALHSDTESTNEEGTTRPIKSLRKARSSTIQTQTRTQKQILTPPASSPGSENEREELPVALQELTALHRCFVQALSVHYAHHGVSSAVPLGAIMPSMTRLWKRRAVGVADVQRMLAVWEVCSGTKLDENECGGELERKKGPFRLVSTGVGSNARTKVEFMWKNASTNGSFIENELHRRYVSAIERLWGLQRMDEDSFVFDETSYFPRLRCEIGAQTQARQEKAASIRDTIFSKAAKTTTDTQAQPEPDFSRLNISDASDTKPVPSTREDKLKSRTLGLFDRLRAKQLANSSASHPPTSAEMLRRRALHRLTDVIDVLRLKQSQKLNTLFRSDLNGDPGGTRTSNMKVSFSLEQLVQEIRDSGRTPIAPEEIKECINILGRDVPDTWCSVHESGNMKCVTLQGKGWTKEKVKEWCAREVAQMDEK